MGAYYVLTAALYPLHAFSHCVRYALLWFHFTNIETEVLEKQVFLPIIAQVELAFYLKSAHY